MVKPPLVGRSSVEVAGGEHLVEMARRNLLR